MMPAVGVAHTPLAVDGDPVDADPVDADPTGADLAGARPAIVAATSASLTRKGP